jgi:hypothetical protein
VKLIDAFLYFNEEALLGVRLEYLESVIDEFWICESSVDFAGKPRELQLSRVLERFPSLRRKIRVVLHSPNLNSMKFTLRRRLGRNLGWLLQNDQRDFLGRYIASHHSGSSPMTLFGDLDEIPSLDALERMSRLGGEQAMQQTLYYGSLLNRVSAPWRGTVFSKSILKSSFSRTRGRREALPFITDGGWHFSYFGSGTQLVEKIQAIAPSENMAQDSLPTKDSVQSNLASGSDPYGNPSGIQRLKNPDIPQDLLKIFQRHFSKEILVR